MLGAGGSLLNRLSRDAFAEKVVLEKSSDRNAGAHGCLGERVPGFQAVVQA